MKNWKSSLFGILMAISSAITTGVVDLGSPMIRNIAALVQVAASGAFAVSTKDKDVTGVGKSARTQQPGE